MENKLVIYLQPPGLSKRFTRSGSIYPPLGLLQLAAMDSDNLVEVLDAEGLKLTDDETKELLRRKRPKIIGLTITSFTIEIIEYWAGFGKELGATILVGGPHASLAPEDVLIKCPSVDIVVRGEAEEIINELNYSVLRGKDISKIKGVCFRKEDGDFYISNEILKVKDFKSLPFPDFSLLPLQNYWCPDARKRPMVTMQTSRGCPFACKFCSSSILVGKKIRGWAVPEVILALKKIVGQGVQEISFVDDEFILNKKRVRTLCQEIIDNGIKISWFCNARADQIDYKTAKLMKLAGCHQIYLGVESGSEKILEEVGKKSSVDKMISGAEILKEVGIDRSVGFIIGLPNETNFTVEQSISLAKIIKPERLQFTRFTPLIGTELYVEKEVRGFHRKDNDKVGKWMEYAYESIKDEEWGKASL